MTEVDPEEENEEPKSPRKTRLNEQEKKELRAAIEVFGEETIMRAINKSPSVKEEADCEIQRTLESYNRDDLKPAKMMRGTTQIVVRMIRDKVRTMDSFFSNDKSNSSHVSGLGHLHGRM